MSIAELIVAVKAGDTEEVDRLSCQLWHSAGFCREAFNAYAGSLDAAKALHNFLLPGWVFSVDNDMAMVCVDWHRDQYTAANDDAARAWLLAILIAKGGA